MKHLQWGNVLKTKYDSIIIISGNRTIDDKEYYTWVSFSSTNCAGGSFYKTEDVVKYCDDCCGHTCTDEECEDCKGKGKYTQTNWGLEDAELLGSTVKSYIMKSLLKNFRI